MKLFFWSLHALFVLSGGFAVWVLSQDSYGSHPPASIFIPFVLLVWLVLHACVGLLQFAVRRGESRRQAAEPNGKWPVVLIVAVLIYLLHLTSLPMLILGLFSGSGRWAILNVFFIAQLLFAGVCMLSILLRWPSARYLAGTGLLVLGVVPLGMFVVGMATGNVKDIGAWLGFGLVLFVVGLGVYLLRSVRVQAFFAARSG